MTLWILTSIGVILAVIEIIVHEFNQGYQNSVATWIAGCYLTLGFAHLAERMYLLSVICFLPTFAILVVKLVKKLSYVS